MRALALAYPVVVVTVAVTLAACADGVFRNPGVTNEQAQRDLAACRLTAASYGAFDRPGVVEVCMRSRGYVLEPR